MLAITSTMMAFNVFLVFKVGELAVNMIVKILLCYAYGSLLDCVRPLLNQLFHSGLDRHQTRWLTHLSVDPPQCRQ